MGFENFRINVVIRILVLSILMLAFVYCLYEHLYLRSFYVGLALLISIVEFIRYVDKTNRDLSNFLLALSQNDFTTTYNEKGKGKSFTKLYSALNQITNRFRLLGEEKEAQYIFLSLLVEHIRVGIVSFDDKGDIHLINHTMKGFLNNSNIKNINEVESNDFELTNAFKNTTAKESRVVRIKSENKITPLTILATEITIRGNKYKLVSAQDIRNELEANELEAWQKLIRVLTHEIMNSVSPIISLTATLSKIIGSRIEANDQFTEMDRHTLQKGMEAILSRSKGLHHFADAYRSLTRLPQPHIQTFSLTDLLDKTLTLLGPQIRLNKISVEWSGKGEVAISADPQLLEQVFINILKNAIEAVTECADPRIKLSVESISHHNVVITIRDNGLGIEKENLEKIFIPFFTTKKLGTGIGLALSKQIIQLHRGKISIESENGKGCVVTIIL